ncbi:hypothetical protein BDV12DRAFT_103826 [Aspergillus spectabilis]
MSFGGPGGGATNIKPTPPERGSFPLDHDGIYHSYHTLIRSTLSHPSESKRNPHPQTNSYLNRTHCSHTTPPSQIPTLYQLKTNNKPYNRRMQTPHSILPQMPKTPTRCERRGLPAVSEGVSCLSDG